MEWLPFQRKLRFIFFFTSSPSTTETSPRCYVTVLSVLRHRGSRAALTLSCRSSADLAEAVCTEGRRPERTKSLLDTLQTQIQTTRRCDNSRNHVLGGQGLGPFSKSPSARVLRGRAQTTGLQRQTPPRDPVLPASGHSADKCPVSERARELRGPPWRPPASFNPAPPGRPPPNSRSTQSSPGPVGIGVLRPLFPVPPHGLPAR